MYPIYNLAYCIKFFHILHGVCHQSNTMHIGYALYSPQSLLPGFWGLQGIHNAGFLLTCYIRINERWWHDSKGDVLLYGGIPRTYTVDQHEHVHVITYNMVYNCVILIKWVRHKNLLHARNNNNQVRSLTFIYLYMIIVYCPRGDISVWRYLRMVTSPYGDISVWQTIHIQDITCLEATSPTLGSVPYWRMEVRPSALWKLLAESTHDGLAGDLRGRAPDDFAVFATFTFSKILACRPRPISTMLRNKRVEPEQLLTCYLHRRERSGDGGNIIRTLICSGIRGLVPYADGMSVCIYEVLAYGGLWIQMC